MLQNSESKTHNAHIYTHIPGIEGRDHTLEFNRVDRMTNLLPCLASTLPFEAQFSHLMKENDSSHHITLM